MRENTGTTLSRKEIIKWGLVSEFAAIAFGLSLIFDVTAILPAMRLSVDYATTKATVVEVTKMTAGAHLKEDWTASRYLIGDEYRPVFRFRVDGSGPEVTAQAVTAARSEDEFRPGEEIEVRYVPAEPRIVDESKGARLPLAGWTPFVILLGTLLTSLTVYFLFADREPNYSASRAPGRDDAA